MPIHNIQYPSTDSLHSSALLAKEGPLLYVEISMPSKMAEILQKQEEILPNPINGGALIDSGASATCVDEKILQDLGLPPVSQMTIATPNGDSQAYLYPVKLEFPGSPIPPLEFNSVIGANLSVQNIAVLIGRDILQDCIFIMNGPAGNFTISF